MQICEVAIAGGGIIGCAIARSLSQIGLRVTLFERRCIGSEASSVAAGMLGSEAETENPITLELGRASRALYPGVIAALREETGTEIEFWRQGTLFLCFSDTDEEEVDSRLGALGAVGAAISSRQARALEPGISPRVKSGFLFADDVRLDSAELTTAYGRAAREAGCVVREGEAVVRVRAESGRVVGIETDQQRIACDLFINAAGAWAGQLSVGIALPVGPVRGQIVVLEGGPRSFRHAVYSRRGYAVTRRDGRVLLGSTRERAGFDCRVTASGVGEILLAGLELSPGLGAARLRQLLAGLRPATPDGVPIIGFDPTVSGYLAVTGHYRNGILLAPITARLVAELVRGCDNQMLASLSPARFERSGAVACQ